MNKFNISSILVVLGFAFSGSAIAQNMSKDEHEAAEKQVAAEYKSDKAQCESLTGNAGDICMAQAKGKEKVAKAELEAKFKPSEEATYKVSVAKAEANYDVSKEKCDDIAGNEKDVCEKAAKAILEQAKSEAKAKQHH
ncbi:MAG: hypothetical protein U1D41_12685 [Nitrosomonas sp.]|uniref:hypothetical protein n=1 Tax=Nitrosomonas sp. TaxID=42353 RepID=UPI0027326FC0|nr:hypothetical protein [Nitrosomonas sp.]MDP1934718.1 hypothetical protein [Nitrosomonas sp.]MDP3663008.1 hypothetical protein [Nitrosomonas sp.]MDZ4106985.1 hypothetical protein [Nitrosomonas sp.]